MRDPILNKTLEAWDGTKVVLRPSSIDGFAGCPRQWAMTFIGGHRSITSSRAAIGTAIHSAVEQGWRESMAAKEKAFSGLTYLEDLAADALITQTQEDDIDFAGDDTLESAIRESRVGVSTFASDIVPFVDLPIAVEQRFTVKLESPVVEALSGTVDYLSHDTLSDLKTSKRKPVAQSHETQQSIYKYLAEANGHTVKHATIQGVVLKAKPEGHVLSLEPKIDKAKMAINTILDVLDVFEAQVIAPEILFRGNPKYMFCDSRYCAFYSTCPYVQGNVS